MLNNSQILNNSNLSILRNKYFFILCLYLKNKTNSDFISEFLFIGYKYNYLILNINTLIKNLKKILSLIAKISSKNGNILVLHTSNKVLNNLLQINCKKLKVNFLLESENNPQDNLVKSLKKFPDLVISFDYKANMYFLMKLAHFNVPVICFTDFLSRNIVNNMFYYLIINNNSLYINIMLIYFVFNSISNNKQYFINK